MTLSINEFLKDFLRYSCVALGEYPFNSSLSLETQGWSCHTQNALDWQLPMSGSSLPPLPSPLLPVSITVLMEAGCLGEEPFGVSKYKHGLSLVSIIHHDRSCPAMVLTEENILMGPDQHWRKVTGFSGIVPSCSSTTGPHTVSQ